jgi:hypothetical protein
MTRAGSQTVRIVDVTDVASFGLIPPCADPGFDHRSCDYWEDADRGSKAARASWLGPAVGAGGSSPTKPSSSNPFLDDLAEKVDRNPFAARSGPVAANPFAVGHRAAPVNPFDAGDEDAVAENPFAPKRAPRPGVPADAPRKLHLLGRGLGVFGSYARVLLVDEQPASWCQFGPLSAYPRAQRLRDLYPRLPASPLPAVITCIASTRDARAQGRARQLVLAVCDDLAGRGFAAVEAYPERGARPDATSAATPEFWVACGFAVAVDDDRFPVVRLELG